MPNPSATFIVNPYHGLAPGPKPPFQLTAYIECPMRSKIKYELDKTSGLLRVDRTLHSSIHYPHNYGFIPQTYCGDLDPLDIIVIGQDAVSPGCLVPAKPIGGLIMADQGAEDFKVIAVQEGDPYFSSYNDVGQLSQHMLTEIEHFFSTYKELEPGKSAPHIGGFSTAIETIDVIRRAISDYTKCKAKLLRGIYPQLKS
jgi:inorganic pyrophosphatase